MSDNRKCVTYLRGLSVFPIFSQEVTCSSSQMLRDHKKD